jgi:hypothetical protein
METFLDVAIDHLVNAEAPVYGPELVPADLSSLDDYGVPTVIQPHIYGLLTSGDPAAVREGNMMLMHYQLLALDRAEGRDRPVRRASALVLPHPLDLNR